MNETRFPLLLTLDRPDQGYEVYQVEYQVRARLEQDQVQPRPQLVARGAAGVGWSRTQQPQLRSHGRLQTLTECRLLPRTGKANLDHTCFWRAHPLRAWPPPHQIRQTSHGQDSTIWSDSGSEVMEICPDPVGEGLYVAVKGRQGHPQLLHWDGTRMRCLLRHPDFRPSEMAIAPDRLSLVFVHQEDDQLYRLDLRSRCLTQLSIPQLEWEQSEGFRAYRSSPSFSPDGSRVFFCTAYLEMRGMELMNWGNFYVLPSCGGALRRLELGPLSDLCPVAVAAPGPLALPVLEAVA